MHLTRFNLTVLVALAARSLDVAAGPIEKKADPTSSAASTLSTTAPVEIILDSLTTTIDFGLPAVTNALLGAPDPNNANLSASSNSSGYVLAHEQVSPVCNDVTAKPFCLPVNNTAVYPGESYYVTWNPSYFGPNSTLNIMLNLSNDTSRNVWSSGPISSVIGVTSVALKQDLPLEDTAYNLTFFAQQFDTATGISLAMYDGPVVQLKAKPSFRYDPPTPASAKEEPGVKIGVPVCLGGLAIIAVGLFYGIRKRKSNRKGWSRGYGIRKSRWQRLGRRGRSKEDEITLQERELLRMEDYTDHAPPAARNSPSMDSLEHLVPAPIEENESAHKEENERNKGISEDEKLTSSALNAHVRYTATHTRIKIP